MNVVIWDIPQETFRLGDSTWSSGTRIEFELIPESEDLPTDNDLVSDIVNSSFTSNWLSG